MNLTIAVIIMVIFTIIVDYFTFKLESNKEMSTKVDKKIYYEFISNCITYLIFTFIVALVFKYSLVSKDYYTCNNNCHILVPNGFIALVLFILQILNIYNFYDSYVHTYGLYARYMKILNKIVILLIGVLTLLFNEFLLSTVDLSIIYFNYGFINIFKALVRYSIVILPVVVLYREINKRKYYREKEKKEFEE